MLALQHPELLLLWTQHSCNGEPASSRPIKRHILVTACILSIGARFTAAGACAAAASASTLHSYVQKSASCTQQSAFRACAYAYPTSILPQLLQAEMTRSCAGAVVPAVVHRRVVGQQPSKELLAARPAQPPQLKVLLAWLVGAADGQGQVAAGTVVAAPTRAAASGVAAAR